MSLVTLCLASCAALQAPAPARAVDPASDQTAAPAQSTPPRALVFEHEDRWTRSARCAERLAAAGFEVAPLPLDRSPYGLEVEVIVLGSFVSEHPGYADYMARYKEDLYRFVDTGRVLVQLTQADQVEAAPPFLPTTQGARRDDTDAAALHVLAPRSTFARGLEPDADGLVRYSGARSAWESFAEFGGFQATLACDPRARHAALLEGAYGQGRIVLAALAPDKANLGVAEADPALAERAERFARTFFTNLEAHAREVRARAAPPVEITASPGAFARPVPGSWHLALLPDTQVYALRYPGLFIAQTGWLRQHAARLDLRFVMHLGDIVNNNTPREWENARAAMTLLDEVVPYSLVAGNHDYGPSGDASTRDTLLNTAFSYEAFAARAHFGGAFEPGRLDNTFHLFEAGGARWIVVALEWGPRPEAVSWANEVMRAHGDRRGILVTHAFLNNNGLRYDHTDAAHPQDFNPHQYRTPGGVHDGEELWQALVRRHAFELVFNGHVLGDGAGYRADRTDTGALCHQALSNYQMRELGGEGYLRLLEFLPDGKTVRVKSYSPVLDRYMEEPDQQFELTLDRGRD